MGGLKIMRKPGTTRTVYLIGNYAIKLPVVSQWDLFLRGLLGNMNEQHISKLSDNLCPTVCCLLGGLILVMRRADELSVLEWMQTNRKEQYKDPLVRRYVEGKPDSWALYEGKQVAIDFGSEIPLYDWKGRLLQSSRDINYTDITNGNDPYEQVRKTYLIKDDLNQRE